MPRQRRTRPQSDGQLLDLTITGLGAQGDGIAEFGPHKVFVPYTLPGDRVTARRKGPSHAVPIAWHARAPQHARPACPHFGACGGCALQHLDDEAYVAWKLQQLRAALAHRGFAGVPILPLRRSPPGARRRADFAVARVGNEIRIGFHAHMSDMVVDLQACPVLTPALSALLAPLRALFSELLAGRRSADVLVTESDSGADMLIGQLPALDAAARARLVAFAAAQDLARIAWRRDADPPEIIVQQRIPRATFAGVPVDLPPGAFLQATAAGEAALVAAVAAATREARRIADLYAGCGTFTLPLAQHARVHAVEGAHDMAAALDAAARRARLGGRVTVERRDLARRPVLPSELETYDAIVFDPPRDGAKAQAVEIARAGRPLVVGVSCNPATFARDARTLADHGYRLTEVTPVDQFLWSPHLELVGVFRREQRRH